MDFAYLFGKNSKSSSDGTSGCINVSTDAGGNQTVTIFSICGASSDGSSGSWIGGALLGAGVIGAGAGMVWGGGVAAGHVAGTGFLAPLLLAEGVYAGGMLGLTVGLAADAVIVGGILIAGGIYYAVTYSNTGR
jgi:hypothetical protein